VDAPAYCLPVNAHILGDNAAGQIHGKPSDGKIEVLCEAAVWIRPWDFCDKNAMLWAFNAVGVIGYLNEGSSPIQSSPGTRLWIFLIVTLTAFVTEWTIIFMPSAGAGMNTDVIHSILIRVEIASFYNSTLDIEQLFA
jgi:hypothetical protein